MITDQETDTLYLSGCLPVKYPVFFERFAKVLSDNKVGYRLLEFTRDVWARDYMPVQIDTNRFIQFNYNPDYLQSKKWLPTITNYNIVCEAIGIQAHFSDLILDGGNVIKSKNKAVLCDKVFSENLNFSEIDVIKKLRVHFETDHVYFIPQEPGDYTGHVDGMVRFVNEHTVLVNDYSHKNKQFRRSLLNSLHNAKINYIKIPCCKNPGYGRATGYYINYLQLKDVVIMPVFNLPEDELAIKQFEQIFYGQKILQVDCTEIANNGGALNCISWSIKESNI